MNALKHSTALAPKLLSESQISDLRPQTSDLRPQTSDLRPQERSKVTKLRSKIFLFFCMAFIFLFPNRSSACHCPPQIVNVTSVFDPITNSLQVTVTFSQSLTALCLSGFNCSYSLIIDPNSDGDWSDQFITPTNYVIPANVNGGASATPFVGSFTYVIGNYCASDNPSIIGLMQSGQEGLPGGIVNVVDTFLAPDPAFPTILNIQPNNYNVGPDASFMIQNLTTGVISDPNAMDMQPSTCYEIIPAQSTNPNTSGVFQQLANVFNGTTMAPLPMVGNTFCTPDCSSMSTYVITNQVTMNVGSNCIDQMEVDHSCYPFCLSPDEMIIGSGVGIPNISSTAIPATTTKIYVDGDINLTSICNFSNMDIAMLPGASIIVTQGLSLNNCHVYAQCDTLWNRIFVKQGIKISVYNNTLIEGGHYAIYALDQAKVDIHDATFLNNYISFYMPPAGTYMSFTAALGGHTMIPSTANFTNLTISGTADLKKAYIGAAAFPTVLGLKPFASILIYDHRKQIAAYPNTGNIYFGNAASPNVFTNTTNGIVLRNCLRFNIVGTRINNMAEYLPYTPNLVGNFSGAGIYTFRVRELVMNGGYSSITSTTPPNMSRNKYGIYAIKTPMVVSNTYMDRMDHAAIYSENTHAGGYYKIHNNFFYRNREFGIFQRDCDGSSTTISDNSISMENITGGFCNTAIYRSDMIMAPQVYFVYGNSIGMRGRVRNGIYVKSRRVWIVENDIAMDVNPTTYDKKGINLTACEGARVNCNYIAAFPPPGPMQVGTCLYSEQNNYARFEKNTFDQNRHGVKYLGANPGSYLRLNVFADLDTAVHYSFTGSSNQHIHLANQFNPSVGVAGIHDGGLGPAGASHFEINTHTSPWWHASMSPFGTSTSGLFQYNTSCPDMINHTCINWYGCYYLPNKLAAPDTITTKEMEIAEGDIEAVQYETEINRDLDQNLYEKLKENELLLQDADSAILDFYENKELSLDKDYYDTKEEYLNDLAIDSTQLSIIAQNWKVSDSLHTLWRTWLDAYTSNSTLTNDSIIYPSSILELKQAIQQQDQIIDSIIDYYENLRVNMSYTTELDYASLNAPTQYYENQKIVQTIYQSTMARGINVFSPDQAAQIWNVAIQCPIKGGKAVFDARHLYSYICDSIVYDNIEICAEEGMAYRTTLNNEEKQPLSLYPNPTTNTITITGAIKCETVSYRIVDVKGQLLHSGRLASDRQINVQHLSPGLYFVQIMDDNMVLNTLKFVKNEE